MLGVLAIIFGAVGIRRANADPGARKILAIIGMVTGIAGFATAALVLLLIYTVITTINVAGG